MTDAGSYFSFRSAPLAQSVAHGGQGTVMAARVLERAVECGLAFVDLVVVPVGSSIGVHTHGRSDQEIYVVIDGRGEMQLDSNPVRVGPGDVVINAPGGMHGLVNTGDRSLSLVVLDVALRHPADPQVRG